MPHCPSIPLSHSFYTAYNAIADFLGHRIPEGRQGPYVICPLFFFFFALAKTAIRRRHRHSLQGNRFAGDHPDFLYTYIILYIPGSGSLFPRCSSPLHRQRLLIRFRADHQRVAGTEKKKKTTPTFRRAGHPVNFAHFVSALRLDSYLQIAALVDLVTVQ